jgi:hypothetical protein
MKKLFFITAIFLLTVNAQAQNVGIGTTTPQTKLHVANGSSGATPFAFSPLVVESNGHTYINLLSPAANETAILFGQAGSSANGVLMYNNTSTPNGFQFRNNGNLTRMTIVNNGNVGIGAVNPLAKLHVTDSSVLFSAVSDIPATPGNIPVSGSGRRMLWYADKAALRAGYVYGGRWNKDSVGDYSIALGLDTKAKGNASVALGYGTTADELASTAMGISTRASAFASTAMGISSIASGDYSTAMGNITIASGNSSTAMGVGSIASGYYSTAIGDSSVASGLYAVAMGYKTTAAEQASTAMGAVTTASGLYSTSMGIGTTASGEISTAMGGITTASGAASTAMGVGSMAKASGSLSAGSYNDNTDNPDPSITTPADRIFQIGNGTSSTRANAMTVLRNGNSGIGTLIPLARLHVTDSSVLFSAPGLASGTPGDPPISGQGRRMMWYPDKAAFRAGYVSNINWDRNNIGNYSVALGYNTAANGEFSFAAGVFTVASGFNSIAMGNNTTANTDNSTAIGVNTIASGFASTAMGSSTIASGYFSSALGIGTVAKAYGSLSVGLFNNVSDNPNPSTPAANDRIFQIGNGTNVTTSNAITVLRNGNTGIGIASPNAPLAFANTTGAKISLYESSPNSQYGFAVQGGQLQLYSDAAAAKISFGYYSGGTYTEKMYLTNSSGTLTVDGVNYPSDVRYKKQITQLQHPLEKIMALNGVEYFMRVAEFPSKHFDDKLQVGLIAQEVEKVLPQVVQTNSDGYKSVDYAKVVPLLVEAVKEQQKQIDELKKIVEKLLKQ